MKLVIQRVSSSSVKAEGKVIGQIGRGLMVLFGVEKDDTEDMLDFYAQKLLKLRIFEDELGKMNKSVLDIEGEILVISQFTLCADCKKGTRPSFDRAMEPKVAKEFYEKFIEILKGSKLNIHQGKFGAMMDVKLINEGPVTIILG